MAQLSQRQPATKKYVKPEAVITVFELLMMDRASPETCWVIKKHWNNKFYYTVASSWLFLWALYYDERIHDHQVAWKPLCRFSSYVMTTGERAYRTLLRGRPVILQMPRKRQSMGAVASPKMKAVTSVKCSLFPHRLYIYTIWLNLSLCLYVLLLL